MGLDRLSGGLVPSNREIFGQSVTCEACTHKPKAHRQGIEDETSNDPDITSRIPQVCHTVTR